MPTNTLPGGITQNTTSPREGSGALWVSYQKNVNVRTVSPNIDDQYVLQDMNFDILRITDLKPSYDIYLPDGAAGVYNFKVLISVLAADGPINILSYTGIPVVSTTANGPTVMDITADFTDPNNIIAVGISANM